MPQHITRKTVQRAVWLSLGAFCLMVVNVAADALHDAAIKGDIIRMQSIIDRQPQSVHDTNVDGDTPLHSAALTGQSMGVQFLLANGADVNARNAVSGATPLLAAAMMGHKTVAEVLLAGGANINQASAQGTTALHVAAYQGHRPMVEFLLARGANVNLKDQTGLMPVQWALLTGNKEIARILLQADPELLPPGMSVAAVTPPSSTTSEREAAKLREQTLALTRALRDAERARQTTQQELEHVAIANTETVKRLQDELNIERREKQQLADDLNTRLTQANERVAELERNISLLIDQMQNTDKAERTQEIDHLKGRLIAIAMAMKEAEIGRQALANEIMQLKNMLIQARENLRRLQTHATTNAGNQAPP